VSTPRPLARGLPLLLRTELDEAGGTLTMTVGKVTALPDATHVTVEIAGATSTVPKLASYAAAVNDACFLLAAGSITLAIGAVK
jgi:hypothetical protein